MRCSCLHAISRLFAISEAKSSTRSPAPPSPTNWCSSTFSTSSSVFPPVLLFFLLQQLTALPLLTRYLSSFQRLFQFSLRHLQTSSRCLGGPTLIQTLFFWSPPLSSSRPGPSRSFSAHERTPSHKTNKGPKSPQNHNSDIHQPQRSFKTRRPPLSRPSPSPAPDIFSHFGLLSFRSSSPFVAAASNFPTHSSPIHRPFILVHVVRAASVMIMLHDSEAQPPRCDIPTQSHQPFPRSN